MTSCVEGALDSIIEHVPRIVPTYATYDAKVNPRSRTSVVLGDVFNEIYKGRGFPDDCRHSTASPQA